MKRRLDILRRGFYLPALLLLVTPASAATQPIDFAELVDVALGELGDIRAPGAAIAVVQGDNIVFSSGLGVANVETGAAVTPDTLFRIGSVTKIFTAAGLVSLAQRHQVQLDQPIGDLVSGLAPKLARLTPHQLLTHTAGLRDEAPAYGRHDPESLGRTVTAWTDAYALLEPGQTMSYSNPGLVLAGFLMEHLTGQPFGAFLEARLFAPLGMSRTTFQPTVAMTYPLAQGHVPTGGFGTRIVRPYPDNAAFWPAGFLFSTAHDLARFAIAFMGCGILEGRQVLSPRLIEKLSVGHVDIPSAAGPLRHARYGYGVMTGRLGGRYVIRHGGTIEGFGAMLTMVPEARVAVVTLVNRTGGQLERTVEKALDLLAPAEPSVGTPPPGGGAAGGIAPEDMTAYVGTYVNNASVELTIEGEGLVLTLRTQQGGLELETRAPVTKVGERRFRVQLTSTGPPEEFVLLPEPGDPSGGPAQEIALLHMRARAFKRQPPPRQAAPPASQAPAPPR